MNCSRCETELSSSAAFCPNCGSTVSQNLPTVVSYSAAETPLSTYAYVPAGTPSFSYLPEGTPPWPTTVPQNLPFMTGKSADASIALAGTKVGVKPKRSLRGVLLVAAFLILTPLVGVVATLGTLYFNGRLLTNSAQQPPVHLTSQQTPNATAASTPTTQSNQLPSPTSFQKTRIPEVNVSFQYPGNWVKDAPQKSSSNTYIGIHPQQQQLGINMIIARFSDATSLTIQNPDEINQANITNVGQSVRNMQSTQAPSDQPIIGGIKWNEQDATFLDSNGNKFHFATISVQHKKAYYTILVFTPDIYYNEAMQKYIQPTLDSLEFIS